MGKVEAGCDAQGGKKYKAGTPVENGGRIKHDALLFRGHPKSLLMRVGNEVASPLARHYRNTGDN
jgi:hypothetical protein